MINAGIEELKNLRKQRDAAIVPPAEWEAAEARLRACERELREVEQELKARRIEHGRLERVRASLPHVSKRRRLLEELEPLADVPALPPTFSTERVEAETLLRTSHAAAQSAAEEIRRLEETLAGIRVPEELLNHRHAIDALRDELSRFRSAENDRPGLASRRAHLEREIQRLMRDLERPTPVEQIDTLRLPRGQRRRIEELAEQFQARIEGQQRAIAAVRDAERELEAIQGELDRTAEVPGTTELALAIQRAERGALDDQLAEALRKLTQLRADADAKLSRLPLFQGTLEELAHLRVPGAETIDRFDEQLRRATETVEGLQGRIAEMQRRRDERKTALDALQAVQDVPTEESLEEARRQRDAGWQLVVEAWMSDGAPDSSLQRRIDAFVEQFAPGLDLPAAYRASVDAADEIADRLRREADRVAQKAQWQAELAAAEADLEKLREELADAQARLEGAQQQWRQLWRSLGIEPLTPREMRSWRDDQLQLVALADAIRDAETTVADLQRRIAERREDLVAALAAVGRSDVLPADAPLSDAIDRSRSVLRELEERRTRRAALLERLADARRRVEDARRAAAEADAELKRWQGEWADAVRALGLEQDAKPTRARAVMDTIDEILKRVDESHSVSERIDEIDRYLRAYQERARELIDRVAPDLLATFENSVELAVSELADRSARAQRDSERRESLREQLESEQRKLREAKTAIETASERLCKLCEQAGCSSADELPAIEERVRQRNELMNELRNVEAQLTTLAGGKELQQWLAEVETFEPDQVDAQLKELADGIAQLEEQQKELSTRRGELRNELARIDGSDRAAELQEQMELLLESIRSNAEQYIRLRLAQQVLRQAMERFRERSQGPVLQRAGEIFAHLTRGSFASICADADDNGHPKLLGCRPGGELVGVEGMSDGTADQLYLALRLALLETSLQRREPIPFIIDDILVMFDDDRATAALEVLAEFADKTQVIYFTHHQHIVDLARENLADGAFCVHELVPERVAS
ncbi:MAG: hypothetical protein D6725_15455 [Planctomycetota bacterium]|nr:MAG: hypothetical protein D6725_15455 [Planctomycetota bacterium]